MLSEITYFIKLENAHEFLFIHLGADINQIKVPKIISNLHVSRVKLPENTSMEGSKVISRPINETILANKFIIKRLL